MAAKVSDVPNSKYHSLFFILGHKDMSVSCLDTKSCPSQKQDGLPETVWSCWMGT